jgi:hypothetical protein
VHQQFLQGGGEPYKVAIRFVPPNAVPLVEVYAQQLILLTPPHSHTKCDFLARPVHLYENASGRKGDREQAAERKS